jgi:hypothetical protein
MKYSSWRNSTLPDYQFYRWKQSKVFVGLDDEMLLCWRGKKSDRHRNQTAGPPNEKEIGSTMKKIAFATLVTGGVAAAILGLGAPALAATPGDGQRVLDLVTESKTGVDHLQWLDDIRPKVNVPMIDTSVRQSR